MKTVTFRVPTLVYMAFGDWANHLPALWRKRIYRTLKIISSLVTVALVVIPALPVILPTFGLSLNVFTLTNVERDSAVGTAILAAVAHLAETNTHPEDEVDPTKADTGPQPPEPDPGTPMPSMGGGAALPMAAEPVIEEAPPATGPTGKPIAKVQIKAPPPDDPSAPTEVTITTPPRNVASL